MPPEFGRADGQSSPFDDYSQTTDVVMGFDGRGASARNADLTPVYAPVGWLFAALGSAIVALTGALLAGEVPAVAIVSWVLGGPVAIGLVTVFNSADTNRRTHLGYGTGRGTLARILYWAALGIGLAAVLTAAIHLALWAGRGY